MVFVSKLWLGSGRESWINCPTPWMFLVCVVELLIDEIHIVNYVSR